MKNKAVWRRLRDELDRVHDTGRTICFWLRDDDAVEPTVALDQLLLHTRQTRTPVTLAVIPAMAVPALFVRLADEHHVSVAVHGWSHQNHAELGEKKQELGSHRPAALVLKELTHGFERLLDLGRATGFDTGRTIPLLVPPWNRISAGVLDLLKESSFAAVSVYGRANAAGSVKQLNTHIDLIDWRGTRATRPVADLIDATIAELKDRLTSGREPVGLLTHHLVHDFEAWSFLDDFIEMTANHPAVKWRSSVDILRSQTSS